MKSSFFCGFFYDSYPRNFLSFILYLSYVFQENFMEIWGQHVIFSNLKGTWGLNITPIFMPFFVNFMEKELCTEFCVFGQNSRSFKVIKFWVQRKWRHTRAYTKYFTSGFLRIVFGRFKEKKPPINFYGVLSIFSELMKRQSFKWLNCISK